MNRRSGALAAAACSALVLVVAVAVSGIGSAAAKGGRSGGELRNARYCEIFVLKGALPDAKLVVWNTIGLNECPAKKWNALDQAELASELGASLVVFNGPRHFLMDSVRGRTGRVRSFDRIKLRRVAAIPISSSAELIRNTYTPRTIERCNVWRWKRGRRVYELRAPDGSVYVMQSYSRILDRRQKIGDLRSLGDRLELPEGWRYRTRRLKRGLSVNTHGEATIIQDELQNTYQQRKPKPAKAGC